MLACGGLAAAAGKLSKGQIIETINGQKLADIDPRIQLGQILAAAEASDGVLKFMVKDKPSAKAQEVIVKIPVLGAYRYRLRVNDGDHVGAGGGYAIYINGKLLIEQPRCAGRGQGAKPKGAFITKEFLKDFQGGEVTIAVKSFLRFNHKYKVKPTTRIPQGRISVHFEEMKLPPLGDDLVLKSATVIPMLSAEWQAKQDPDNKELQTGDDMFRWDGKFADNPSVRGSWKTIDQVETIDEFTPEKKMNTRRARITEMIFKNQGKTDSALYIWSGDTLMDLDRYEALRMTVKKIAGTDYLFVEAGGFSTRNKPGWRSPWCVMKRVGQ